MLFTQLASLLSFTHSPRDVLGKESAHDTQHARSADIRVQNEGPYLNEVYTGGGYFVEGYIT